MQPHDVQDVTVRRDEGIDIVFADGHQCSFELQELRLGCPCAGCRADREKGREPWPTPRSPLPLTITDAELVGAWGISITWNDGHRTGIYPWDALRRWCEQGAADYPPDSGLGQIGGSPPQQ